MHLVEVADFYSEGQSELESWSKLELVSAGVKLLSQAKRAHEHSNCEKSTDIPQQPYFTTSSRQ